MARMPWTTADIADQKGRTVVITGANSGLGLEAARALAEKGAHVVMACRNTEKGKAAAAGIKGSVETMALDLSSLKSISAFAKALGERHPRVDVLMNNAGVMAIPRAVTADGFEMQFGTNHLGHFALTAQVLPLLEASTSTARIVSIASNVHWVGSMKFDDLMGEKKYGKWPAYCQSKLANLLFTYELERWLRKNGKRSIAVAAHPGYAATNLQGVGPQLEGAAFSGFIMKVGNSMLAQPSHMGALPQVYAAVHPDLKGGEYIGPDGFMQQSGFPRVVSSSKASKDEAAAARLWTESERLTNVTFAAR